MKFLGVIENDPNMSKAVYAQKTISLAYPESVGAKNIKQITEVLLDMKDEYEPEHKGLASMFARFFQ